MLLLPNPWFAEGTHFPCIINPTTNNKQQEGTLKRSSLDGEAKQ
jgi:hypothetical protein